MIYGKPNINVANSVIGMFEERMNKIEIKEPTIK
jgi:hypothetical protein